MFFHALTMTNVGPFVGTTTVDLAQVGQSGLFLLEGPTGAGKSTVLDSIVFALFGDVGAPHGSTERMRSSFALPTDVSEVALVFETTVGVFRVQRTPSYDRPKRSGHGTTRQNATVKLWRLSGPDARPTNAPISTKHGEADAEIQRIVGLNRAQFVQTILLPQGEFANFLRAKPESRRDLLQKIFGTELYDRIAGELDARRRTSHNERTKAQERVGHALTAFLTTVEATPEQSDVLRACDPEALPVLVAGMTSHLRTDTHIAQQDAKSSDEQCQRTREALRTGEEVLKRLDRKRQLEARMEILRAGRQSEQRKRDVLSDLDATYRISPTYDSLVQARATELGLTESFQAAGDEFEARFSTPLTHPMALNLQVQMELQSIQPALRQEEQLPELVAEAARHRERGNTLAADLRDLEAKAEQLPQRVAELSNERDSARSLSAEVPLLVAASSDARTRRDASRRAVLLTDASACASQRVTEAQQQAKMAAVELGRLQQQRIDGIAGELARDLVDGGPCIVCGALEHPQPNSGNLTVDQKDLMQAATDAEECVAQLSIYVDDRERVEIDLAEALAQSAKQPVGQLEEALAAANDRLAAANEGHSRLAGIDAELATGQKLLKDLAGSIETQKEDISTCTRDVKLLEARISDHHDGVQAARGPFSTVAEHAANLTNQGDQLELLATMASAVHEAQVGLSTANKNWDRALDELALSSGLSVEELLARQDEIVGLRDEIATVEREYAVVEAGLSEIADQDIARNDDDKTPGAEPDVEKLGSLAASAETERDDAKATLQRVEILVLRADSSVEKLEAALTFLEEVMESTAEIIRLSEIANATTLVNGPKISLPTYVLMSRFHDVVVAANTRLQAMSDGRFTLVHSFEKESHGRKSGLGIMVRDHLAECDRSPGDLSGGETFYTSLALALGLADVVTAEAGGVDLGTLFIDEGFGALDPETLDSVLAEIARLRQGGRVVGVVSHVDELKQRISDRIEVRRLPTGGSTIRIVA